MVTQVIATLIQEIAQVNTFITFFCRDFALDWPHELALGAQLSACSAYQRAGISGLPRRMLQFRGTPIAVRADWRHHGIHPDVRFLRRHGVLLAQ